MTSDSGTWTGSTPVVDERPLRILVTGASGFIGRHLLTSLSAVPGYRVLGVGRRENPSFGRPVNYRALSLSDLATLGFRPDVVVHAAGSPAPWASERQYWQDNVQTTADVLRFCQSMSLPRLIFISTPAVCYRDASQPDLTESAPVGPSFSNGYAQSKAEAETLVHAYGGRWMIVRPCAVFGIGDTLLLPPVLDALRRRHLPLLHDRGVLPLCDLMDVAQLCDYLTRIIERPDLDGTMNLSHGHPMLIRELLGRICAALALPLPRRTLDVRTAQRLAGWVEWVYRRLRPVHVPPLTRFAVGVLGYSKTLDVSRAIAELGPPSVAFDVALAAFLSTVRGSSCG